MAPALLDDLGEADDLRPRAYDDEELQAAVVLKMHSFFSLVMHYSLPFAIDCLSERSGGKSNSRLAASLTKTPM